jgi:alpha-glucosidase
MLKTRAYELRLPTDWPPVSVTVNGKPVPQSQSGKKGWKFEGNTLTTVIPVPSGSVAAKVTIEVRRAPGLTARRNELDGFAGAMTRLRGAYDVLQLTYPLDAPTDPLIDAMQCGNHLSYHPERAVAEIAHFHDALPKARISVAVLNAAVAQRLKENAQRISSAGSVTSAEQKARAQRHLDALSRALQLVTEAGK